MGYVGSVLYGHLRQAFPSAELWGFDNGYFAHCLTNSLYLPECQIDRQFFGDMRVFPYEILDQVDVLVQLGAISNDPMGNRYEELTAAINERASKAIAREAKRRGVEHFVFASSCSMYGQATGGARKETDSLNPLTAYARSKVAMERELQGLAEPGFTVTSLRFSTACGMSPRLRLDLVVNDFVASAIATRKITVLSDGTPWRPLVHVKDMARAIVWGIGRPQENGGAFLAVNVGRDDWNYQVRDLASSVARLVPETEVSINLEAQPDRRSYRVDFSLFKALAPDHQPLMSLDETIQELKEGLEAMTFVDGNFRESNYMRLKMLESHVRSGALTRDLEWTVRSTSKANRA